jgi:hypothetical protein
MSNHENLTTVASHSSFIYPKVLEVPENMADGSKDEFGGYQGRNCIHSIVISGAHCWGQR